MSVRTSDAVEAAPAQLASVLLAAALSKDKSRPTPASSGLDGIDSLVLDGGFRYGEITSIAGASGMGKSLIALHALASHLIQHQKSDVALIDSTGSFSPIRLRDIIAVRLKYQTRPSIFQQSGYVDKKLPQDAVAKHDVLLTEQATRMLDSVRVMRVFDFAGVVEAVGEVSEVWARVSEGDEASSKQQPLDKTDKTREEIADSEDEEGQDGKTVIIGEAVNDTEGSRTAIEEGRIESPEGKTAGIGMIILDTVTNVVSSLMAKNQVQGHALVTTLMRTLRHLCTNFHLCTILVNSAVGLNPSTNPGYQRRAEDNASVFESTVGKPALGKTFSYLIDTSIFLSNIPNMREDAEVAFDDDNARQWNSVGVFEVLKNKHGTCEGQWALFRMADGVSLRSAY